MTATPPAELEDSDFETIEAAVLETARGRWFLREFARRARAADTARLLDAVARIERVVTGGQALTAIPFDAEEPARALEERHDRLAEIAWMLRERGYDGDICALIEREARAVGRVASGLRAGAGSRTAADPLIEARAASIGQPALAPPEREPVASPQPPAPQPEITPLEVAPVVAREDLPPPAALASVSPTDDWRARARVALAPIERMNARERLALFA